jgi:hypothetical protein
VGQLSSLLVALDAAGEAWVEYSLPADAQRHVLHVGERFHRALLTFDKGAAAIPAPSARLVRISAARLTLMADLRDLIPQFADISEIVPKTE